MQDPVLHFRSEVLETIGEIQQKCMLQTFLSHLEIKLIDLSIVFLGTIGDAPNLKMVPFGLCRKKLR
jgi:hypothetical protein